MQHRLRPLIWAAASIAFPACAQQMMTSASASSGAGGTVHGTFRFSGRPFQIPPVTGAPYSAERVSEHVQTAPDGTRFTTTNQREFIYRDSQGRTRTERRAMMMGPHAPDSPVIIDISDPVANVAYTLDTQNKIAHRVAYSSAAGSSVASAFARTDAGRSTSHSTSVPSRGRCTARASAPSAAIGSYVP